MMNVTRSYAACAIFKETIVVSGGIGYDSNALRTVELYDVFDDVWTPMPSMTEERSSHSLICVKSKLFAIGGTFLNTDCEVYDKTSNMFVTLEASSFLSYNVKSVLIGSKIFVYQNDTKVV